MTTTLKYLFFLFFILALADDCFSKGNDDAAFNKGSNTIYFAAGFGVDYNYYQSAVSLPAFSIMYDHGIMENVGPGTIGIGGLIGIKTAHYDYHGGYKATWNNYVIAARATYHLTILKDKNKMFDPYAGIVLGLRIYDYHDSYYDDLGVNPYTYGRINLVKGVFIGAKYNFTPAVGVFAEAGYDISLIRVGLNINF